MPIGLDAAQYAATNARVRGLYAALLDDDTWSGLVASPELPTTVAAFRNTPYAEVIREAETMGDLSLEQIERRMWGRAAANVRKTMSLLGGSARALLLVWWQHFELENLKALFRGFDQGMEPSAIRRFLISLSDDLTLSWETLLHERSVINLIDRLSNTRYINPLRNALPVYQRERSLFPIEIALDIRYYRDLAAAIGDLGGSDRAAARRILGTHLDILNILWAYRYRLSYGLSAEEIVNYTLWRTIRTDATLVREIALGADPRDILVRVWGPSAVDLSLLQGISLSSDASTAILPRLELTLERFWRRLALRELEGYPFGLGAVLGYLVLQELEVHDLVTLLEGKSMGWKQERISQLLIRSKE
jgi:V/A-type H+-transporting ATPase subunit C